MLKRLDAAYEPSWGTRRSDGWVKCKKDYIDGMGDSLDLVPIGGWRGQGRIIVGELCDLAFIQGDRHRLHYAALAFIFAIFIQRPFEISLRLAGKAGNEAAWRRGVMFMATRAGGEVQRRASSVYKLSGRSSFDFHIAARQRPIGFCIHFQYFNISNIIRFPAMCLAFIPRPAFYT